MNALSDCTVSVLNSAGASAPTNAFDIDTAYASAPAPIATAPGSAVVGVVAPDPDADWSAPSTCADTALTPLQAVSSIPPSGTESAKIACTHSSVVVLVL